MLRPALISVIVLALLRPLLESLGGPAQIIANVAFVLGILWLVVVGCIAFEVRPRTMTLRQHRYFFRHQSVKPPHLFWPGETVVRAPLKRRRHELAIVAIGAGVVFGLSLAYREHLTSLSTPSEFMNDAVFAFLINLGAILVITWFVMAYRRHIRHVLAGEGIRYEPWSSFWLVRWYERRRRMFVLLTAGTAVLAVSVAGLALSAPAYAADAVVEKIVDGDTLDVRIGDHVERVRLLNVDTPELHGLDGAECLAVEAKDALAEMLPVGSDLTLGFDRVRHDKYGRTLAAVFASDGTLVNAELAARGLGARAYFGDNKLYLSQVDDAVSDAEADEVGFYDPKIGCTPAAITGSIENQLQNLEDPLPTDSASIATLVTTAAATTVAIGEGKKALSAMRWLDPDTRSHFRHLLSGLKTRASTKEATLRSALDTAQQTEKAAAEKAAAERAAAEKAAAEKAAADQAAADQAAADRAAAEQLAADAAAEAARQADAEESYPDDSSSGDSGGEDSDGAGDGGGSTYTGCRNYNGYGMIDTKGRHFEPISC